MIIRSLKHFAFFLLLTALNAEAASEFDCHITVKDVKFDLTKLEGEHIVNRTRSTPPTTVVDSLRFNLCSDLKQLDGIQEQDQVCYFPSTQNY